ncbi:MAG TPA: hypothetical protein VK956_00330, partial [Verrucomicrobium sp.]|nr:hypothetical protein [Verrucomicrobium sp.]
MTDFGLSSLREVILMQFPDLSGSDFRLLTAGWQSVAVAADGQWLFKFPRTAKAGEALRREAMLLQ